MALGKYLDRTLAVPASTRCSEKWDDILERRSSRTGWQEEALVVGADLQKYNLTASHHYIYFQLTHTSTIATTTSQISKTRNENCLRAPLKFLLRCYIQRQQKQASRSWTGRTPSKTYLYSRAGSAGQVYLEIWRRADFEGKYSYNWTITYGQFTGCFLTDTIRGAMDRIYSRSAHMLSNDYNLSGATTCSYPCPCSS